MKKRIIPAGESKGVVFDIQRYSLHDGPGLRTNVFLKGCTLDCWWCSNPEGRNALPEIAFFEAQCFFCGDCIEACDRDAINTNGENILWEPSKCNACGQCIPVCPSRAFRLLGKEMTAAGVIEEVLRDRVFFIPNGGLTLTGGEPSLQTGFTREILRLAKAAGLNTAIETCGAVPQVYLAQLLPFLDLILFDLKHLDPEMHLQMTGQDNQLILDNFSYLVEMDTNLTIRIPLIPGFNAEETCLRKMARFIRSLQKRVDVHLLSYHTLGRSKYAALSQPYRMGNTPLLKTGDLEKFAKIFIEEGLRVTFGE